MAQRKASKKPLDGVQLRPRTAPAVRQLTMFGIEHRTVEPIKPGQKRVVLSNNCFLLCPDCGLLHHIELRPMDNGKEIRNQPRCYDCRGGPKTKGKARG